MFHIKLIWTAIDLCFGKEVIVLYCMPKKEVFNEATFRETPLPMSGNFYAYIMHISRKHVDLNWSNIEDFLDLGGKKIS